jgi:hypothetical protein
MILEVMARDGLLLKRELPGELTPSCFQKFHTSSKKFIYEKKVGVLSAL